MIVIGYSSEVFFLFLIAASADVWMLRSAVERTTTAAATTAL
jgi:hypothetical protein